MMQRVELLEQQQERCKDASERISYECQVFRSCGMQQAMEMSLLTEQNRQARASFEEISCH
eukprot:12928811-Prorocentrum_lima.AAC.1